MSHNSDLSRHYHTLQHITLHYATQLHLITELHTRFLNILIPFTMKMVGPLETHERLLNYVHAFVFLMLSQIQTYPRAVWAV